MVWSIAIPVFFFGLVLGSFATALGWRIPRGVSVIHQSQDKKDGAARSACPHCGATLGVRDLIPLFSWLSTRGRCRHCGELIGWSYPLVELSCGVGAVGLYIAYGITLQSLLMILLLPCLAAMFVIDLRYMILPDMLMLAGTFLGAANVSYLVVLSDYQWLAAAHYISAAVFYAVFAFVLAFLMSKILKRDAMGMGDVKFFFVVGLFLGFPYFSIFLILSGVFGVLFGVVWQKVSGRQSFPFGPALILSLYACLVLQGLGIVPLVGL